jgi:hypothetical protein
MKINVHIVENSGRNSNGHEYLALHVFDFYYAYMQSKNQHSNYQADLEIAIGSDLTWDPTAFNIGFYNMPETPVDHERFDLIMLNANGIGFEASTEELHRTLVTYDNACLMSASYVDPTHPLADKIITFPYFLMTRDWFNRPFYPQYYERKYRPKQPGKNLIFINGQNRPHRQYMQDLIGGATGVDIRTNNFSVMSKLSEWDYHFESAEDTVFRNFVNNQFVIADSQEVPSHDYYDLSIKIGIDQKYGSIPPGYFIIDEYWDYRCVIFPETNWYNDNVFLTEKIGKTLVTKTLPWPIGGANTDVLYNQLGIKTAWNLLPERLQLYNCERDHAKRYQMCAEAIRWVGEHPEVLTTPLAQEMLESNYIWFFDNTMDANAPVKLDKIIQRIKK